MKRTAYKSILILFFVSALLISFYGCSGNGDTEGSMINDTAKGDDLSSVEPPCILTFRSLNDYKTFADSQELSDEEFNAFIAENSYNMNGISTKDDVVVFCDILNNIPFPESDELTFSAMQFYHERNECDLFYKYDDNVNCVFTVYLDTLNDTESVIEAEKANGTLKPIAITSDEIQELYRFENADGDPESYYAVINNYLVQFRIFNITPEQAQGIINETVFTTLQGK